MPPNSPIAILAERTLKHPQPAMAWDGVSRLCWFRLSEEVHSIRGVRVECVCPNAYCGLWRFNRWIGVYFISDPEDPKNIEVTVTYEHTRDVTAENMKWLGAMITADPLPGECLFGAIEGDVEFTGTAADAQTEAPPHDNEMFPTTQDASGTVLPHLGDPPAEDAPVQPDRSNARMLKKIEECSVAHEPQCDPLVRAALMFREMDVTTHPIFLTHPIFKRYQPIGILEADRGRISLSVIVTMGALTERVRMRRAHATHEPPIADLMGVEKLDRFRMSELSLIQRMVFSRWYPKYYERPQVLRHLSLALLKFAAGSLYLEYLKGPGLEIDDRAPIVSEGAPDGPGVFLFAEFAAAAIDFGEDIVQWEALLPAMVAMIEVYRRTYGLWVHQEGSEALVFQPRTASEYVNRRPKHRLGKSELEENVELLRILDLHQKLSTGELTKRIGTLAKSMFTDGFALGGTRESSDS